MDVQDRYFELLKREIFKDTSFDFNQFKNNYLKRRLSVRMRVTGVETYGNYLRLIRSDPSEYNYLLKDITINVTQFFRDPEVFNFIEKEILPILIYNKVKKKRKVIRLWSAGCATGEEAYSLAILLKDLLAEKFHTFLISIYGTDIDDESLAGAKVGKYLPRQMEFVKPYYLKKYFTFDGEKYHISEEIKDLVRFRKQDLFSDETGSHFDMIFCRNVMIYFTKEMQEDLFTRFYEALNEDGYLIIGKTEGLFGTVRNKFITINSRERIFQKNLTINSVNV